MNGVHPLRTGRPPCTPIMPDGAQAEHPGPPSALTTTRNEGRGPCSCSNSTAPMPPSHRPPLRGKQPGSTSGQEDYRVHRPSAVEALDRHTDLPRTVSRAAMSSIDLTVHTSEPFPTWSTPVGRAS